MKFPSSWCSVLLSFVSLYAGKLAKGKKGRFLIVLWLQQKPLESSSGKGLLLAILKNSRLFLRLAVDIGSILVVGSLDGNWPKHPVHPVPPKCQSKPPQATPSKPQKKQGKQHKQGSLTFFSKFGFLLNSFQTPCLPCLCCLFQAFWWGGRGQFTSRTFGSGWFCSGCHSWYWLRYP